MQEAKKILVHPKSKIILVLSNYWFFQYCDRCKVIAVHLLCFIFGLSCLLPFLIALFSLLLLLAIIVTLFLKLGFLYCFPYSYQFSNFAITIVEALNLFASWIVSVLYIGSLIFLVLFVLWGWGAILSCFK